MAENPRIESPPWSLRTKRTAALILLAVGGIFAWRLADMWPPLVVSMVLAYLLSPMVAFVERVFPFGKPGTRRLIGTILTFSLAILVVVLVAVILVPSIVTQMRQFGDGIPPLIDRIENDLGRMLSVPVTIGNQTFVPLEIVKQFGTMDPNAPADFGDLDIVAMVQDLLGPLTMPVLGALGTAVSAALTMIIVLTMIFYLLKDGPHFISNIENLVVPEYRADIRYLFYQFGEVWNAYLRGQIILSVVMGVVVFFAATILGVRSPLVLGMLSGVLEFIPNIGPALALLPAAVFALFFPSSTIPGLEGPMFMLVVVIVWTGLQNLESIFLVPRIMGGSLDLHPFIVIVAVVGGATLAGALGVILAAPVVASLRVLGEYAYMKLLGHDVYIRRYVTSKAAIAAASRDAVTAQEHEATV